MSKHIILLTSTIRPKLNQANLTLTDPLKRLKDYKTALEFYQRQLELKIVDRVIYVDNSGYDLKTLSDAFSHPNIEWISFNGLDYPTHYHRGYGEFKLINYAFDNSSTLKSLAPSDKVWKVTGRYIIKNISTLIRTSPKIYDLYVNKRNNWVDMEVMSWSRLGYENFINIVWPDFATARVPELILSEKLCNPSLTAGMRIADRFFWAPIIIGRRGTDGGTFQNRFSQYKMYVKIISNFVLLPWRHILYCVKR